MLLGSLLELTEGFSGEFDDSQARAEVDQRFRVLVQREQIEAENQNLHLDGAPEVDRRRPLGEAAENLDQVEQSALLCEELSGRTLPALPSALDALLQALVELLEAFEDLIGVALHRAGARLAFEQVFKFFQRFEVQSFTGL